MAPQSRPLQTTKPVAPRGSRAPAPGKEKVRLRRSDYHITAITIAIIIVITINYYD